MESAFAHLGHRPTDIGKLLAALFRGKAALKAYIAAATEIDPVHFPYNSWVIGLIEEVRAEGRAIYLASASNERYVRAVAAHLDLLDGCYASSASENLSSAEKAARLARAFGKRYFDYIGNDDSDLAVWAKARLQFESQSTAAR